MKPHFRIEADGADVTAHIDERFVSLSVTDHSGFHNDRVSLTLDDRDPPIALTGYQTRLRVWMGYAEDPNAEPFHQGIHFMGTYYVDEIQVNRDPARTVTIVGRANDTSKAMKSIKTRSWEEITLGEMIEIIASEHAYTPRVHPAYAQIQITHQEQTAQSDQGFLTMLANKYDAVSKVVGEEDGEENILFFGPRAMSETASDQPLTVVTMPEGYLTSWNVVMQTRSDQRVATSRYYDDDEGEEQTMETPAGDEPLSDSEATDSEMAVDDLEADQWSRAQVGRLNREKETLSFSVVGIPQIRAEVRIDFTGLRAGLRTTWLIVSTKHTLSRSGYITTGQCVIPSTSLAPVTEGRTQEGLGGTGIGSGVSAGNSSGGTGGGAGDGGGGDGGSGSDPGSGGTIDDNPPEPPPEGYTFFASESFDSGDLSNPPGGTSWGGGVRSQVTNVNESH